MLKIGLQLVERSYADRAGQTVFEQEDGPLSRFVKRVIEVFNAFEGRDAGKDSKGTPRRTAGCRSGAEEI